MLKVFTFLGTACMYKDSPETSPGTTSRSPRPRSQSCSGTAIPVLGPYMGPPHHSDAISTPQTCSQHHSTPILGPCMGPLCHPTPILGPYMGSQHRPTRILGPQTCSRHHSAPILGYIHEPSAPLNHPQTTQACCQHHSTPILGPEMGSQHHSTLTLGPYMGPPHHSDAASTIRSSSWNHKWALSTTAPIP